MCAHTSLGTQPIYLFGTDEQKQQLHARPVRRPQARRVRADRARGGLATPATSARAPTLDGDEWVIDGAKQFITNAGTDISGLVAITARTGGPATTRSPT